MVIGSFGLICIYFMKFKVKCIMSFFLKNHHISLEFALVFLVFFLIFMIFRNFEIVNCKFGRFFNSVRTESNFRKNF
jgi:uncharacterized protein (UPF0333 family)